MSYARPQLDGDSEPNQLKLQIPKGWYTTITSVSRRTYNQLVVIEYENIQGGIDLGKKHLANTSKTPTSLMENIDEGGNEIYFAEPQGGELSLAFKSYYSTSGQTSRTALARVEYASSAFKTHISDDSSAPEGMPDYMTVLIFVQDASGTAVNDLVVTISMFYVLPVPPPTPPSAGDQGIQETVLQAVNEFIARYTRPGEPYPTRPPPYEPTPELAELPVCIIGAGVAGLYIGMILDTLGIPYEILEGSGRIGGRLYTHRFPQNPGKYQYFDVGAMRYPRSAFMQRTFDLVERRLDMPDAFIPYTRVHENTFLCYNDITTTRATEKNKPKADDIFNVSKANGGNIPPDLVAKGATELWEKAFEDLRENFATMDFLDAYNKLMEYDQYSVSGYLQHVKGYSIDVINWLQSQKIRTGQMDAGLTETVLLDMSLDDPRFKDNKMQWFCLDGGSEVLTLAMTEKLSSKPLLYHRVTAIEESDDGNSITVTFDKWRTPKIKQQSLQTRKYSNVISTMSFACLRMVDLNKAGLNYGQKNAIRDLMYAPSVKVGMQWKTPWWERLGIEGGQSSTDLPIKDVVYPSFGPDDSHEFTGNKSNCMIASYNAMQDSQRLGGLMHGRGTPQEDMLLELIMRNLAQLHNVPEETLWQEFEDYHAWNWGHHDSFQLGAFGNFSPGQFKYVYPYVQQPASSKQRIHFAGDTTSAWHGWVAGSLNSGWRAVMGMLISHPELNTDNEENLIKKFQDIWGKSEELDDQTFETVVNLARTIPRVDVSSVV